MGVTDDRDHPGLKKIGPDGMQETYLVLSPDERAKGFVRPYRTSYKHIGPPGPKNPLRDLTIDEQERYKDYGYVKFEEYPESDSPVTGRFWTQEQLDKVNKGCHAVTHMNSQIAETYARDPKFYGGTFCVGCQTHLPVGPDGEFAWITEGRDFDPNDKVGT